MVADSLEITNGHAARMRFSRFKQQMEGIPTTPRKPRPSAPRRKKAKPESAPKKIAQPKLEQQSLIKVENRENGDEMNGVEVGIKPEPRVKTESTEEDTGIESAGSPSMELEDMSGLSMDPRSLPEEAQLDTSQSEAVNSYGFDTSPYSAKVKLEEGSREMEALKVKKEPLVKMESGYDG